MGVRDVLNSDNNLELKNRQLKGQVSIFRNKFEQAQKRTLELERLLDQYSQLSAVETLARKPVRTRKPSRNSAVAILHFTDWHVGELVTKNKTNGLNRFNPEICKERVDQLIEGAISLIRLHQETFKIEELLIVLGGDFVTGFLHPELEQTNALGPVEEQYLAIELLYKAITQIFEAVEPKKLRIVCHRGNHGRSTHKMQFKNDFETNNETLLYWVLRDRLQDKRIEWVIEKNAITYTEIIEGVYLRTAHGHQIKFRNGVGGLLVPANRWVLKQNQTKKAALTMLGHFHTRNQMKGILVSGSLKGFDEYALELGFEYEPPSQSFDLFDLNRRQFSASWPIFVG